LRNRLGALIIASTLLLLAGMTFKSMPTDAQVSATEHVYYGYVPTPTFTVDEVDELIGGTRITYDVPANHAILDVVGLEDGTAVEVWDLFLKHKIQSVVVNKFEKKVIYIYQGTYFKITASKRIAALLSGGISLLLYDWDDPSGTSTFYPAVTGGFRGKEFIFNAAPATHAYAYSVDRIGYNFYLMALDETDWTLTDSVQLWSASGHLPPRGTKTTLLQSRIASMGPHGGAGNDVVFHLTTSSDVEVSCCALGDFLAVPAITGGYVGKLFYAPLAVTLEEAGRTAAFIAVPLEEGEVRVYDKNLNVIATHSFTASDVSDRKYWYYELGSGRFNLIAESTSNMCFMVGQTEGKADISHLGDDVTFIGSRPGQEIRFYAPTNAVIFAPQNLTITVDGSSPIQMEKDEFKLLEPGAHSVSADKHVIVEVLAYGSAGTFFVGIEWENWGSYLIEPLDVDINFEALENFLTKQVDYMTYITPAAVAVAVVLALFVIRRRRARGA